MIGGLRIAVVSTVAIATIAASIGENDLGAPIFYAIQLPTPFKTEIYSAGFLAVALALLCDAALVLTRRLTIPGRGRPHVIFDQANAHTFVEALRFIVDNPHLLLTKAVEQLELSGAALGLALAVALPLGIVLGHLHRGSGVAIGASIVGRALPSIFLIAVFLTILGLGFTNNMVALAVLALGPILTNAYLGVEGVDGDAVEAARGHGALGARDPDPDRAPAGAAAPLHRDPRRRGDRRRDRADRGVRRRRRARRHHREPGDLPPVRRPRGVASA